MEAPVVFGRNRLKIFCERGGHDCFDGVHTVLGFIEYDGSGRLKDFVGDFHAVNAELLEDGTADRGFKIVEGRSAVHEHAL